MTEEKTAKKKTASKKVPVQRKVAPDVIVKSPTTKSSVDELYRDNPTKSFRYAPVGTGAGELASTGLKSVIGTDGKPMRLGARLIVEDVGKVHTDERSKAHAEATTRANELKDPSQSNSKDRTAVAKLPVS